MTSLMSRCGRAVRAGAGRRRSRPRWRQASSLERLLYRRLYGGDELDQVLLTMGLIFMSVARRHLCLGPAAAADAAAALAERRRSISAVRSFPAYRSFLILCGAALVTALWLGLERTRFGAQVRAAVDNLRMAQSVGINTSRLFTIDLRAGQRACRARRRARRRPPGDQPELRAREPRLFPDRRRGRRARQHPRAVRRGAAARHRRYRLQIPAARTRRVLHLCADDGDPAVAAARPVRARLMATSR